MNVRVKREEEELGKGRVGVIGGWRRRGGEVLEVSEAKLVGGGEGKNLHVRTPHKHPLLKLQRKRKRRTWRGETMRAENTREGSHNWRKRSGGGGGGGGVTKA